MSRSKRRRKRKHEPAVSAETDQPWLPKDAKAAGPPGRSSSPAFWIAMALIVVAALLVYSNTFSSPFLFDDEHTILENPRLRELARNWPPSGTRWLGNLTFAINYQLGKLDVVGYHVFNLSVHAANGLLVFWLVLSTFATPRIASDSTSPKAPLYIALIAALLFVCHPVQTQAVTYIVQRFASLATLLYLLSLTLYVQSRLAAVRQQHQWKAPLLVAASVLSAVLAMKTKEIAFTLPIVVVIYDLVFFGLPKRNEWLPRALPLVPILVTLVVIPLSLAGRAASSGGLDAIARESEVLGRGEYLLTQFRVLMTYIRLLILPVGQSVDYDYPTYRSISEPDVWLSLLCLAALAGFALWLLGRSARRDDPLGLVAAVGIIWFFVTLSVESSVIPITDVIVEHRLYLASVGAFTTFAVAIVALLERARLRRLDLAVAGVLVLIAVPLAVAAHARNRVWRDEITLWEDVVDKAPHSPRGHNNLAKAYGKAGRTKESRAALARALALAPGYAMAHFNLAVLHEKEGDMARARAELEEAIRLDPTYVKAHINLGNIEQREGHIKEAVRHFEAALGEQPNNATAHFNLGNALALLGRLDDAITHYREAKRIEPDFAGVEQAIARVLSDAGRDESALEMQLALVEQNPDDAAARSDLGALYFRAGRLDDAAREYEEALRLDANNADALQNLGTLYATRGDLPAAIAKYEQALTIEPDLVDAHYNIGLALKLSNRIPEARRHLEEVLQLEPGYAGARELLDSIAGQGD